MNERMNKWIEIYSVFARYRGKDMNTFVQIHHHFDKIFQNLGHSDMEWVDGAAINHENECIKHIL